MGKCLDQHFSVWTNYMLQWHFRGNKQQKRKPKTPSRFWVFVVKKIKGCRQNFHMLTIGTLFFTEYVNTIANSTKK